MTIATTLKGPSAVGNAPSVTGRPSRVPGSRHAWPGWDLSLAVCVVLSALPLWLVPYPPIQDLPQHLAAIRVLHSYADPAFGFERLFDIELLRTQYLTYYLAAHLLSFLCGVTTANKILVTLVVCSTPYAMRGLLSAIGKDPRLCVFVLPLVYNAHLVLGFFNFLAAIPLALYGLALAARQHRSGSHAGSVALACVALLTFYTHVVPFGFLAAGAVLLSLGGGGRTRRARLLWPLLPALLGALVWSLTSPAGQSTLAAAWLRTPQGPGPVYLPFRHALRDSAGWLTDVLHTKHDQWMLGLWSGFLMLAFTIGLVAGRRKASRASLVDAAAGARLALLAPAAVAGYFLLPVSYAWIWPISARLPLLAAVFIVLGVPALPRAWSSVLLGAVMALGLAHAALAGRAFLAFQTEVGRLDAALAAIPARQRVAGLIWDRGSRHVRFAPFIHSVAYYQVRKGGAVMFSFADFPQSPFRFKPNDRPPRVPARWEWTPEQVKPLRDLGWYDYVLVRGTPGVISELRSVYQPLFRSRRWSVWKRLRQERKTAPVSNATHGIRLHCAIPDDRSCSP
ncbi:MAG: hypothetical protein MJD61_02540 [Proteobacteria bacterium]|nr:hypothetical protein [Pseudomonadota bacterium]